jgi:transposase
MSVRIDLGKNTCGVVGQDASGQIVIRRRVKRDGLIDLTAKLAPCADAMGRAAALTTSAG